MMHSKEVSLLPLNRAVVSRARKQGIHFSDKTYLIAVQHLLDDTLDLYHSFIALGIPAENIFTLGKVYSNIPRVLTTMKSEHIQLHNTTVPPLGEFYSHFHADVAMLWQRFLEVCRNGGAEKILILDDGGILINKTPTEILNNYQLTGEEQTTSGLFAFEKQAPPFPIVSEASSAVKMIFESPMFTKAAVQRVMSRASEYSNLPHRKCGVIGMGSIGTSLATNLSNIGCDVYTFDTVIRTGKHPAPSKATQLNSLQDVLETCDYVFGCTGRNLFEHFELPLKHKDGQILASVSSGDIEFLSLINHIRKQGHNQTTLGDVVFKSQFGTMTILQNGYPINFDGTQGSASSTYTQLTTSMLLSGVIQAWLLQTHPNYEGSKHTIVAHSPEAQRFLLSEWFRVVPEMKQYYSSELLKESSNLEWFYQNSGGTIIPDDVLIRMFSS